jgi:hypothetical protein
MGGQGRGQNLCSVALTDGRSFEVNLWRLRNTRTTWRRPSCLNALSSQSRKARQTPFGRISLNSTDNLLWKGNWENLSICFKYYWGTRMWPNISSWFQVSVLKTCDRWSCNWSYKNIKSKLSGVSSFSQGMIEGQYLIYRGHECEHI